MNGGAPSSESELDARDYGVARVVLERRNSGNDPVDVPRPMPEGLPGYSRELTALVRRCENFASPLEPLAPQLVGVLPLGVVADRAPPNPHANTAEAALDEGLPLVLAGFGGARLNAT